MIKRVAQRLTTVNLDEELRAFGIKIDYLSAQHSDVLEAVEHEEIQPGKKRKREVDLWCASVERKKIKYQAIDSQFRDQGPSRELKSQLAKEIKEVDELIQQGKFSSGVVLDDHPSTRLEMVVTSLVDSGSAENIEMISKWLNCDDVFAIGVCGMGGVGKTTLLKKIHNCLLQDSDIEGQVYWVTASRDCNLQKLQTAIGKCLGLRDLLTEDEERRKSLIFHRLSQLQKSVLIIDDMWNHFPTDQVGIPLNSCGCKVIITTRSEEVCRKMRCQKVIKVNPLPEDDAWSLFVEQSGKVPYHLFSIAQGVVEECGGLPLALITMGCCMREVTDAHQWKNALYELQKPTRRQDNEMDDHVFRVLQYSYDSLADERMRQCFLSCILFPEDSVIGRDELIDLWIMEGLLDDVEAWENKVNKGHAILNKLERSSLLEPIINDLKGISVRMHDLVRDMAIIVTQHHPCFMAKAGLLLDRVPEEHLWTCDLVKVSLNHNYIKDIPRGMSPKTSILRVLILSDNPLKEIPDSFFVHMKALEVLDLSRTRIERLPDTVSDLINLRALLLQGCKELRYVPSVANLTKLMVFYLPQTGCIKAPAGMERLTRLQKLSYCVWSIAELPRFNRFIQSCHLYSYCIWLKNVEDEETVFCDDALEFFRLNKKAVIISGVMFGQVEITPMLPSTIQALYVCESSVVGRKSLGDVLPCLSDAKDLRVLTVKGCAGFEYIFPAPSGVSCLDNLEDLKLIDLPDLRGFAEMGLYSSFAHLKDLEISKCPKIKALLPPLLPQQQQVCLPRLVCIRVKQCDELEEILESNRESSSAHTAVSSLVAVPELESLELEGLPKLGSLYSIQLHLCTSLDYIGIRDCAKLEEIVRYPSGDNSTKPVLGFPSLSMLTLERLPNLSTIYPMQLHLSTLLRLISILSCPKLEGIVMPPGDDSDTGFPSLLMLWLSSLPNLSTIYPMRLHLSPYLNNISIIDCAKLKGIFESPTDDMIPILALPKLAYLDLGRLPNLSSIYRGLIVSSSMKSWSFKVDNCPKLKTLPLSDQLTCDASPSTLASFPTESENPAWWEPLYQDFPDDVVHLSGFIQQARRLSPIPQDHYDDPQSPQQMSTAQLIALLHDNEVNTNS